MSRVSQRIARVGSVLVFGVAAVTALRLAVAEIVFRQDTVASLRLAIAMQRSTPSAEFERELADRDSAHSKDLLEDIVRHVNPRSSAAWMELGRSSDAESALLAAATVDHQYLPAWTLTNFYFRKGNQTEFWMWADRAATLMYDEYPPLFQLCEQFEADPEGMLTHFHDSRRMRPPLLKFLISENRLDAAQTVAIAMADDRANDPHLIDLADRQIRAGNIGNAVELWNRTAGLGTIDPGAGKFLTNGDLTRAPLNLGFDWKLNQWEGVATTWRPSELIFRLSGAEPESCVLLEQAVVLPSRPVVVRFDYLTGTQPARGIRWSLDDKYGPEIEPSEHWRESVFDVPRAHGLARLQLRYRREPGMVRTEGRLEIRNVRMEPRS